MKRKVIKQGHNTLTITLPAKWVDANSVKPGDEVDIEEKGNALSISRGNGRFAEVKELDVTKSIIFLERELYSLYKKGYDEVRITSEDPALLGRIQKILTDTVVGFEIVSQTTKSCIIKNVAEIQDSEFEAVLRRTLLLLNSMAEGVYEAMKNADINSIPNLRYMEKTNNRYTGFLRRVLNKRGKGDYKNEKLLYGFVEFVEKIADEYKYLCIFFEEDTKRIQKISKNVLELHKRTVSLLRSAFELYYKFDKEKLIKLYNERKNIIKEVLNLMNKSLN